MKILSTFPRPILEIGGATPQQLECITFADFGSEEFFTALATCECLFTSSLLDINAQMINAGPELKLIQTMGVSHNLIDLAYAAIRNIYVCNNKTTNTRAVAEFAVVLILAVSRKIPYYERQVRAGEYKTARQECFMDGNRELGSRKVGLIGFGDIAMGVAKCLSGFECDIYYHTRSRRNSATEEKFGVKYLPFEELLSTCDVLSLHVAATPETVNLIGEKELALMRPGAILINTASSELVDSSALAAALAQGKLGGAAVDVVCPDPDPPPPDHPLLNLPPEAKDHLIITPHVGGPTVESIANSVQILFHNAHCVTENKTPKNVVNGLAYLG